MVHHRPRDPERDLLAQGGPTAGPRPGVHRRRRQRVLERGEAGRGARGALPGAGHPRDHHHASPSALHLDAPRLRRRPLRRHPCRGAPGRPARRRRSGSPGAPAPPVSPAGPAPWVQRPAQQCLGRHVQGSAHAVRPGWHRCAGPRLGPGPGASERGLRRRVGRLAGLRDERADDMDPRGDGCRQRGGDDGAGARGRGRPPGPGLRDAARGGGPGGACRADRPFRERLGRVCRQLARVPADGEQSPGAHPARGP